jgi:hypothetical protein
MFKMLLVPIYWGPWWEPSAKHSYNWQDVNELMTSVVSGRYMDGLNQYGIGRGSVATPWISPVDPPDTGFGDVQLKEVIKTAIDEGHVPAPFFLGAEEELPFYSLIVKPGIEHLRTATPDGKVKDGDPDTQAGGYHFPFSYEHQMGAFPSAKWQGQACWIKAGADPLDTVQRWAHEMAEAYVSGFGEIADMCEDKKPVWIEGVALPLYWSQADNACMPIPDGTLHLKEQIKDAEKGVRFP